MSLSLTTAQDQALDITKNSLVEAGAGSGKTFVFVQRYLKLLRENPDLEPRHILAITFTTLASQELLERLYGAASDELVGALSTARISTIHGFCSSICREFPFEAEVDPAFEVMAPEDSEFLLRSCIFDALTGLSESRDLHLKVLLGRFSFSAISQHLFRLFKSRDLARKWLTETSEFEELTALGRVFQHVEKTYASRKLQHAQLDYDDLIEKAKLVLNNTFCLKQLQKDIKYILVDEFQDTDPHQWDIIQLLCDTFQPLEETKLFLVGDIKQSIYSFRGADSQNFLGTMAQFETHDRSQVVHLSDNFRTYDSLLQFLNPLFKSLFEDNTDSPIPYTALSGFHDGASRCDFALLDKAKSFEDEAHFMANWILTHKPNAFGDVAILLRRRKGFQTIKRVFESYGIPVQFDKPMGFSQLEVVHDLLQLVKGLADSGDTIAWSRVLTSPLFGIDYTTLFTAQKVSESGPFWERVEPAAPTIRRWFSDIQQSPIMDVVRRALLECKAWEVYQGTPEKMVAKAAIESFLILLSECNTQSRGDIDELVQRLEDALASAQSPSHYVGATQTGGVRVLTIHSSKGLEFPVVILGECQQPYYVPKSDPLLVTSAGIALSHPDDEAMRTRRQELLTALSDEAYEESKRLFYVACTRAKEALVFTGRQSLEALQESEKTTSFFDFFRPFIRACDGSTITLNIHGKGFDFGFYSQTDSTTNTPLFSPQISVREHSDLESSGTALQLPEAERAYTKVSVSDLEALLVCAKKYRFGPLITHLPSPQTSEAHYGPRIGSIIHAAITRLNHHPEQSVSEVVSYFENQLNRKDMAFVSTQVSNYHAHDLFKLCSSTDAQHEAPFSVKVGALVIEGRFDCIVNTHTHWEIIDYKTDVVSEHPDEEYRYQMTLYAVALSLIENIQDDITCRLFYTRESRDITLTITPEDRAQFIQKLTTLPSPITKPPFTPPPKPTCQTCPYYQFDTSCPETN